MLSNCCCCFNLELGYFTFSIINLAVKFCSIAIYHYIGEAGFTTWAKANPEVLANAVGFAVGYTSFTAFCLFLTLKGIMQKRSILMFPYIIVASFELLVYIICLLTTLIFIPLIGVPVFFGLLLNIYIMDLHLSIYKRYKMEEQRLALTTNIENAHLLGSYMMHQPQ